MLEVSIEIDGIEKLQERLRDPQLIGVPLRSFMNKAAHFVEAQAKRNASGRPGPNVITGRLRSSIASEVHDTWAKIGTNVEYATAVEFGHGNMVGRGSRGGTIMGSPFAIGKRQSRAYPFLYPALKTMIEKVDDLLKQAAESIKDRWKR